VRVNAQCLFVLGLCGRMMRFSVGVVGAGAIAQSMHLPVLLSMPRVRLAWVADSNADRARSVGAAYGIKTVCAQSAEDLPESDVVLLAIPVGGRGPYLDTLAEKKTAVFAEKPFAITSAEHRRILDLFSSHRLGCGYMRRFYAATVLLRQLLGRGWFGPLKRIRIAEGNRSTRTGVDRSFLDDARLASGGVLAELGCHTVDLALYLTGAEAFEVKCCTLVLDGHVDRKVSARVSLRNSSALPREGAELDYCASWLDRQENVVELQFERTSLWAELVPGAGVFLGDPGRHSEAVSIAPAVPAGASTSNQAFYLEWDDFLTGLETGRESAVSASSAVLTTELIEQLYKKGGSGRA
jgi:predicted dehydrogenase